MEDALLEGVVFDQIDEVRRLCAMGVQLSYADSNGYTALHWACCKGNASITDVLLKAGSKQNALDNLLWTPLHYAAYGGHVKCVMLLLKYEADPTLRTSKGRTAIQLAKASDHPQVVELLKNYKRKPGTVIANSNNTNFSPSTLPKSHSEYDDDEASFEVRKQKMLEQIAAVKDRMMELDASAIKLDAEKEVLTTSLNEANDLTAKIRSQFAQLKLEDKQLAGAESRNKEAKSNQKESLKDFITVAPFSDVQTTELIGSGAFSEVYKGTWRSDDVAVKILKLNLQLPQREAAESDKILEDIFYQETTMLARIRHPNIVLLMAVCVEPTRFAIVTELLEGGDLCNLIRSSEDIPWPDRLQISLDISKGMNYLHSARPVMVHRDLKSMNVLLDATGRAKISDFGTMRLKERAHVDTVKQAGTPAWMAPECLRGEEFDEKSDVYSFGVILWELLMRKPPWEGKKRLCFSLYCRICRRKTAYVGITTSWMP